MTLISALARRLPKLGGIIAAIPAGAGAVASVVDEVVCGWFLGNVSVCLKIKISPLSLKINPGIHSGRYCT